MNDFFNDKKVNVCGGVDVRGSSITLVHIRERFTAHETSVNQLMQSKVDVKTSLSVKVIEGSNGEITEVVLASRNGNE
ncbi:hypothetical protein [Sporosarcina ureae]|uniref:hypothetical protein n=1 Tax=Sporosarcina ureae TaxID=1571 RepID=UPI00041D7F25|nr:hypothetical protein [Sporosarcina ureae]